MDKSNRDLNYSIYPSDKNIHPKPFTPDYRSSMLRSPKKNPLSMENITSDLSGHLIEKNDLGSLDNDLTKNYCKNNEPIGERIVIFW